MKTFSSVLLAVSLGLSSVCCALSTTGPRTLVVVEDDHKSTYSTFVADLQSRGFEITILNPKSPSLNLFEYDTLKYEHVIIFPTSLKALGPELESKKLLEHASKGGNLLVFLDSSSKASTPNAIQELAGQLDITLAPKGSVVVDHFSAVKGSKDHDEFLVDLPSFSEGVKNYFVSGGEQGKVVFKGQGFVLGQSPLLQPILKAPRTAYSYDPVDAAESADEDSVFAAGSQLVLVAGVQSRNNARITFVGGADVVSDAYLKDNQGVNRIFAKDVSAWTFQETGVVRVDGYEHWGVEKGPDVINGDIYRVKSEVTYTIHLSEYSHNVWTPFTVPPTDQLQLEFRMLDPYYRLNLLPVNSTSSSSASTHSSSSLSAGSYTTTFTTPDQHGIFTFGVNYKRPFLTYVHEKHAVTVRHFAHNEWTRSWGISGSWVWIAGIWVVVAGWIGFVAVWLYSVPKETVKVAGKKL